MEGRTGTQGPGSSCSVPQPFVVSAFGAVPGCSCGRAAHKQWSKRRRHLSREPLAAMQHHASNGGASAGWASRACSSCYCRCACAAGVGSGLHVCAAAAAADASAHVQLEMNRMTPGLTHSLRANSVPHAHGPHTKGMLEGRRAHNGACAHLSVSAGGLGQHGTVAHRPLKYCISCQRSWFTTSASVERNPPQLQQQWQSGVRHEGAVRGTRERCEARGSGVRHEGAA